MDPIKLLHKIYLNKIAVKGREDTTVSLYTGSSFIKQASNVFIRAAKLSSKSSGYNEAKIKSLLEEELPDALIQVLDKKDQLKKLALDVSTFDKFAYLGRSFLYPVISDMSQRPPFPAKYLPSDVEVDTNWNDTVAIFLIGYQGLDSIPIVRNMKKIKSCGGIIFSITDSASWGWAGSNTDYRFIVPRVNELLHPMLYHFTLRLFKHYLRQI